MAVTPSKIEINPEPASDLCKMYTGLVDNTVHSVLKGNTLYASDKSHPNVLALDFREIAAEIDSLTQTEA